MARPLATLLAGAFLLALASASACGKGVTTDPTDPLPGSDGSRCSNGAIDDGEECDGAFLDAETCESLGHGPGMLACDPVTCMFDTSMCENMPMDSGGTGGGMGGTGG